MAWIYLVLAGLFEIGFTTSLKLSENLTHKGWATVFLVCILISFFLLNKAIQDIPVGTAYAVWSGIGAVGTALIGIVAFQESVEFWRIFFIVMLIVSILGLKIFSGT